MKRDDNLGMALALLKTGRDSIPPFRGQSGESYVKDLRIRSIALKSARGEARLFNNIPEGACYTDKPYLADNTDFFLALFLNESDSAACSKLITHLNNCYSCFEIFTGVVRDYYRQYQQIHEDA